MTHRELFEALLNGKILIAECPAGNIEKITIDLLDEDKHIDTSYYSYSLLED